MKKNYISLFLVFLMIALMVITTFAMPKSVKCSAITDTGINAKSAVVIEANSKRVLLEKNSEQKLLAVFLCACVCVKGGVFILSYQSAYLTITISFTSSLYILINTRLTSNSSYCVISPASATLMGLDVFDELNS